MKLNTHDRTPRPENNKLVKGLLVLCSVLMFGIFGFCSFAFFYAKSFIGGISVIGIAVLLTAIILIHIKDMERAYVEIKESEFHIVDYYWGIKKEKHISSTDITSAEILMGHSLKEKGYRFRAAGMRYIVFRNGNKYLFKIIALPETEELFKQYIQ